MTPTELARETLLTLAARKLPPTPENYQRVYDEIGEFPAPAAPLSAPLLARMELLPGAAELAPRFSRLQQQIERQQWDEAADQLLELMQMLIEQQLAGQDWSALLRGLIRAWDMPLAVTQSHKRDTLDRVLASRGARPAQLYDKLQGLVSSWSMGAAAQSADGDLLFDTIDAVPGGDGTVIEASPTVQACLAALREALTLGVHPRLAGYPELQHELVQLARGLDSGERDEDLVMVSRRLKRFWIRLELATQQDERLTTAITRILDLLLENLVDFIGSDAHVQGQISAVRALLADSPVSMRKLYQVEAGLKEAVYRQGLLRHSLDEATDSMRHMLDSFIHRVSLLSENTDEYQNRFSGYAEAINASRDPLALHGIVDSLMADTRAVHLDLVNARDELVDARLQVGVVNERIRQLESELVEASARVKEDQLTGALNRRGLDELFSRESDRAQRERSPLSLALIDIDNFKQLNDHYGHLVGDDALRHVVSVVQSRVRPSDGVARFGGEEFIILMPGTDAESGCEIIERLQRELTKTFFMAHEDHVVITFSAGVARWMPGENELDLIERADHAMYKAKVGGKNQVMLAPDVLPTLD
ncbi:MAG: diguanylate cyclase [Microvirgula sp.]